MIFFEDAMLQRPWKSRHKLLSSLSQVGLRDVISVQGEEVGESFNLLLGKTGKDTFALHFREPFGMAQAFGVALSAMHSK